MTTVIIPTYNGAHKICNILHCLERQHSLPDEVIVVIDGSTDHTRQLLQDTHFDLPKLRVLAQSNGGRSKVRNYGAREATGDLLIFMDDDMLPAPECIAVHQRHHKTHQNTILTGAQIDLAAKDMKDIRKYKSWLTHKWSEPLIKEKGHPLPAQQTFITAANCSVPAALFWQLQGFDERLRDAEDYDLAVRAVTAGIGLYYDHDAFAWHDDRITCNSYIKRQRQYLKAQQKLEMLWQERKNKYSVNRPSRIKSRIYKIFCNNLWVRSIDRDVWPYLLPRMLRYKLYDIVIAANGIFFPERINL